MSKLRLFFLIILMSLLFFTCKQNNPIPTVFVNFYIQLNSPLYNALNIPGNSIVFPNEGYKGVIVTRIDFETFAAFDAACTFDPDHKWGRVVPDGVFAKDTVCGSKFFLMFGGSVFEGPAKIPLKMYMADYNPNSNTVFIHN
jgi:hypothetical protein